MKLIITLADHIIGDVTGKKYTSGVSKKLMQTLKDNDAALRPLYENTSDPEFQKYFVVEIDSPESANRISDELLKSGAITSAYVKPADEQP